MQTDGQTGKMAFEWFRCNVTARLVALLGTPNRCASEWVISYAFR